MPPHPVPLTHILTAASHIRRGLQSGLIPSGCYKQNLLPHAFLCPAHLILLDLMTAITVYSLAYVITSNYFRVYVTCTDMSLLLTAFRHENDNNFQYQMPFHLRKHVQTGEKNYTLSTTATQYMHQLKTG